MNALREKCSFCTLEDNFETLRCLSSERGSAPKVLDGSSKEKAQVLLFFRSSHNPHLPIDNIIKGCIEKLVYGAVYLRRDCIPRKEMS